MLAVGPTLVLAGTPSSFHWDVSLS